MKQLQARPPRLVKYSPPPRPAYSETPDAVLSNGTETYKVYLICYHKYRWGYGLVCSKPDEVFAWDVFWAANTRAEALDRALHDSRIPFEIRERRQS